MAKNKAVLIVSMLACLAAAYGGASNGQGDNPTLQQALDSLSKGDYTSAQRQGQTLASRSDGPDGRGWLITGWACQQQKDYPAAIDAYKRFLATNTSADTRQFVTNQIAACQSAQKAPQVAAPPSKSLSSDDLAELAKVEATTTTESSEHFVVNARNAKLAKLLVQECETALTRICGDILAGQEFPHSVEVNVWTDEKDYHANVQGEPDWAGGSFSVSKVGGVIVRRIDLAQLDSGGRFAVTMLDRILPHELCHLVTREFFGDSPVPLFLNEGLAMLAEPQTDVQRTLLAGSAVAGKEKIPLDNLLVRQINGKRDVTIFYAESQSFTEFLHARLSDQQFRDFLEHLKSGCTVADALQRALYAGQSDSFMPTLAAAWEDHAIQQGQLVRALRGRDLTMRGK